MGQSKSSASGTSVGAAQVSTQTKDATGCHQINMRMVQNVLLIWLDSNIDDKNVDCRNTMMQLRRTVHSTKTFTDGDQCIQFLKDMDNEKICMIVSGSVGQYIVPQVHHMLQVDSIFIFCGNKNYHEQWAKEWSKIKGVFTEISSICEAIKKAADECEHNAVSISIMATSDGSKKHLDQLDPSFMYMQIMKEILLDIDFAPKHIQDYVKYCRDVFLDNDRELEKVKKLERKYRDETPIWWYTLECFLYPMVNRGLRTLDVDIIIKIGFFIRDLHNHIKELHDEQYNNINSRQKFIVYRGQRIEKMEFEHMTKSKGGLIAFNSFLSTSKNRSVSLGFAQRARTNPDSIGVLFIMTIDPSQSTTPFASIKNVSAIPNEDEVLFAMQTVFRIGDITPMNGNSRLFQAELTLTNDNDKDLRQLTDYIRKETSSNEKGWHRLGLVLRQMGYFGKSEEVYQILLEQTTNENEKGLIYLRLGLAKCEQAEHKEAIAFYEKAMEIFATDLPSNNLNLASSYNNIGNVYYKMSEYSKALSYYEKSLEIDYKSLPSNHPDLAMSYNNIGNVYHKMGEYSEALSYYGKSLIIRQQSLPPNHPDLAGSYNNMGAVYKSMGENSKALSYYEKSLEIKQQSLPTNHPDLGASYNNIGVLYEQLGEYAKALSFFLLAVENGKQSLPLDHPILKQRQTNLDNVKKKL